MKILAVIRESTDHQDTESQKREMRDFCISKGFQEEDIVYIESAGASARKANKKYLQMLDNIKSALLGDPDMNACAFWHLNRLGRRKEYIAAMEAWFVENKIQVYVKEPSITLLDQNGNEDANASISFSVFAAMVELDTKEMFAKMKRGKDQNRIQGKFQGGPTVHWGYKVDSNGYLVPNKEEMDIISLIFREYATGNYSFLTLSREIDSRGITIRGSRITRDTVVRIFNDEKYIELIGQELWDKVQAVKKGLVRKSVNKTTNGEIHYALRILRCPECGHYYSFDKKRYRCIGYTSRYKQLDESKKCQNGLHIDGEIMDDMLWHVTSMEHIDMSAKTALESLQTYEGDIVVTKQKISALERKQSMINERYERNTALYIAGDISTPMYKKNKEQILRDKTSIEKDLEEYRKDESKLNLLISSIKETKSELGLYVTACQSLFDMNDRKKQYALVHKYVRDAYFVRDTDPNAEYKQAIVTIESMTGKVYKFKYIPRPKKQFAHVYIWSNGDWRLHKK